MSNKGFKLEKTNVHHRTRSKATKHLIRQAKKDKLSACFSAKTFLEKDKK